MSRRGFESLARSSMALNSQCVVQLHVVAPRPYRSPFSTTGGRDLASQSDGLASNHVHVPEIRSGLSLASLPFPAAIKNAVSSTGVIVTSARHNRGHQADLRA